MAEAGTITQETKPATDPSIPADVLPQDMLTRKVPRKINDKIEYITVADAVARSQKGDAAQQTWQEAAAMKRDAETAMNGWNDMKGGIADRDPVRLRRALKMMDLTDEQIGQILPAPENNQTSKNGKATAEQARSKAAAKKADDDDDDGDTDDDPRITQLMSAVQQQQETIEALMADRQKEHKERERTTYQSQIDMAIDRDPYLTKVLSDVDDDEVKVEIRQQIYNSVAKAMETMPWGPRAIQEGIKKRKALLGKLRGGTKPEASDILGESGVPDTGSYGSANDISTLYHSTGKKAAVSVNDAGYSDNWLKRVISGVNRRKPK